MSKTEDVPNPPAFPRTARVPYASDNDGMTLRDWFAGQALCSIPLRNWDAESKAPQQVLQEWVDCAYAIADAMLRARGVTVQSTHEGEG
jgi:hypothetical protein